MPYICLITLSSKFYQFQTVLGEELHSHTSNYSISMYELCECQKCLSLDSKALGISLPMHVRTLKLSWRLHLFSNSTSKRNSIWNQKQNEHFSALVLRQNVAKIALKWYNWSFLMDWPLQLLCSHESVLLVIPTLPHFGSSLFQLALWIRLAQLYKHTSKELFDKDFAIILVHFNSYAEFASPYYLNLAL